MNEPTWLRREAELLEQLGKHLREAQTALERGDEKLRDVAIDAAAAVHSELGGVLREGAAYLSGLAAGQLRTRRQPAVPGSQSIH